MVLFLLCILINVNVLQVNIGKLVTAMGGALLTRTSSDVSFVIVKNVLAAKYKVFRFLLYKCILQIIFE